MLLPGLRNASRPGSRHLARQPIRSSLGKRSTMSDPTATPRQPENQILALLPAEEFNRFSRYLQPVDLPQGLVLYEAGVPFDEVYFVDQGMVSVVSIMESGATIEVGTIGNEGLAGLSVILGVD